MKDKKDMIEISWPAMDRLLMWADDSLHMEYRDDTAEMYRLAVQELRNRLWFVKMELTKWV